MPNKIKKEKAQEVEVDDISRTRVNFTVPPKLKQEWIALAKAEHITLSELVRNAIREYRKKIDQEQHPNEKQIQTEIREAMKGSNQEVLQFLSTMKTGLKEIMSQQVDEPTSRKLTKQIKLYLTKNPATYDELKEFTELADTELMNLLNSLLDQQVIKSEKGKFFIWSEN